MTPNISTWLRAFRPPLQRAYPRLEETGCDFTDLLERADARKAKTAPANAGESRKTPRDS
jgi:hypothetical protein